jgi:phosphoribulokinase
MLFTYRTQPAVIARMAIAFTVVRLTIDRTHLRILYGIMAFSTAVGAIFLFFTIFQCYQFPTTGITIQNLATASTSTPFSASYICTAGWPSLAILLLPYCPYI